ncbi:LacI family DNA-binding transcriptional regulator [Planomonospora sp. ID91781]|uniref:LacI family DNA-binding transcriptional regulator n=1 Tax=Planomonospora sp. ID91781 TaxID=2738135 RepID=UPI0018C42F78|nr:LacI family DNA-binding transcriptional regulator [Planomonospora sp. ID91781]MBG0825810.1 LacI family DNA-binding transcriptional regulator [Planomonospora sp. ID91781]
MGASLKDVAARAGVSVRTVSNVVNDFPLVAPETRRRVQIALEELRYRPNVAARRLRAGRSGLIGLVIPEIDSPYFGELASLLVQAAQEHGWTLLVDQTNGDPEHERRLLEGMPGQLVDGLIMSPWGLSPVDLRRNADAVPLVLLGEQDAAGLIDHVSVNSVLAAAEATAHLIGFGRRRIAAIGVQPHLANGTAEQRLTGYRQALRAAGIPHDPALEVPVTTLHRDEGARAMRRLLDGDRVPDAVFCFSDQLALGALRAALEHGLSVPRDLAVCGFDDIEDGRYVTPSLTTVAPNKAEIARQALVCLADRLEARRSAHGSVDLDDAGMVARVEGSSPSTRRIVASHRLVVRESTAGRARKSTGNHPAGSDFAILTRRIVR